MQVRTENDLRKGARIVRKRRAMSPQR